MGMNFDDIWPKEKLQPVDPSTQVRLCHEFEGERRMYIHNLMDGSSHWEHLGEDHCRLILSPDEGSSLFAGFVFMAHKGAAIGFNRDERLLVCTSCYEKHLYLL